MGNLTAIRTAILRVILPTLIVTAILKNLTMSLKLLMKRNLAIITMMILMAILLTVAVILTATPPTLMALITTMEMNMSTATNGIHTRSMFTTMNGLILHDLLNNLVEILLL